MTTGVKEPGTASHQVFISYASENIYSTTSDRQVADQICSELESQGIGCWIAHRDILPGDDWMSAIIDAVDQAKIIILVFSANTEKSKWVKDEIGLALDEDKTIIPFRIQEVYPQRELKLLKVRCQWMHAFTPPLEKHIENLAKIVSRHLGLESAIPIKKEKINKQPGADQIIPAAKEIKAVIENKKEATGMPVDVKKVISIAQKVDKNKSGYWEAYYQDGIIMVYIPAGEFMMGQTDEEKKWLIDQVGENDYNSYYKNETPFHKVYLDGYWMGKYEVTFAQFDQYCDDTKIEKPGDEVWGRENRPAIYVSWNKAAAYCEWLSDKIGFKFKLPTEAQWEKASRGNDQRKYPWGSREPDENLANFIRNIGYTKPVGSYPAGESPYGLLDMAGNVWEWCSDWFDAGYYKNSPLKNPMGPNNGSYRVFRGGSWYDRARELRCASRWGHGPAYYIYYKPSGYYNDLGFRLCQDI